MHYLLFRPTSNDWWIDLLKTLSGNNRGMETALRLSHDIQNRNITVYTTSINHVVIRWYQGKGHVRVTHGLYIMCRFIRSMASR